MKPNVAAAVSEAREKNNMVRPKKYYGQHFLRDKNIAAKIASALSYHGYDYLIEVGPGTGFLTDFLLDKPLKLIVIEKDKEAVNYLKTKYKDKTIEIVEGDFLKIDLASLTGNMPFAVIGNFPYNISTQIVFKILDYVPLIPEAAGMFQREVAERIAARPGSKTYGILSVLTQLFYRTEILFHIPPSVFYPPPKVQSSVIKLTRKEQLPDVDFQRLKNIVKKAFNQRRKTLRNSLKNANLPAEKLPEEILNKRPEALAPEDFLHIYRLIYGNE